jgi:hypothetical protein
MAPRVCKPLRFSFGMTDLVPEAMFMQTNALELDANSININQSAGFLAC